MWRFIDNPVRVVRLKNYNVVNIGMLPDGTLCPMKPNQYSQQEDKESTASEGDEHEATDGSN